MRIAAEIGMNHDGNMALAQEMIRRAKQAGADIAKFQFGWRAKPGEINAISPDDAQILRRWCDYAGIEMLASVITEEGFELAKCASLDAYKIASRTVVDAPDLCRRVLDTGKPTYVSLGMWKGADWPFGPPRNNLRYIYCVSRYPTAPWEMKGMPERFGEDGYHGYSDHGLGIEGCVLAVARGAEYVEKHFTLDKTSQVIRDHVLSADPEELDLLVRTCRPLSRLVREVGGGTRGA